MVIAGRSSLTMVPVPVPVPIVAPVAADSASVTVSFASTTVSPVTATWTIFEVSPAAKVSVPAVVA